VSNQKRRVKKKKKKKKKKRKKIENQPQPNETGKKQTHTRPEPPGYTVVSINKMLCDGLIKPRMPI
jgi:hypothetical protein